MIDAFHTPSSTIHGARQTVLHHPIVESPFELVECSRIRRPMEHANRHLIRNPCELGVLVREYESGSRVEFSRERILRDYIGHDTSTLKVQSTTWYVSDDIEGPPLQHLERSKFLAKFTQGGARRSLVVFATTRYPLPITLDASPQHGVVTVQGGDTEWDDQNLKQGSHDVPVSPRSGVATIVPQAGALQTPPASPTSHTHIANQVDRSRVPTTTQYPAFWARSARLDKKSGSA